ncbi:hypothetical protein [Chelativorans salis]|uniref:DUF2269 domain-containing protein n=1 Tax=Chelativorans salis TaxID=2978478 RepID=A0ABT2LV17_9HYPH|nr:hypothetical protein [Chelativorans sp. EGI FJ00035]MCT7378226.1 hypothetical protein [Chelativorans sp. EGI FJ00035]
MTMAPRPRKTLITAHVVFSLGWVGALTGFLVLAVAGLTSPDGQTVRAAYIANGLITWYAIVPLAFASLLTGIVQALATPWGLLRNYWVVFKLVIVVTATAMLMGKTSGIGYVAQLAAERALSGEDLLGLRYSIAGHALGGLAVLVWAAALGVFKPRGLTRLGRRKQAGEPPPS